MLKRLLTLIAANDGTSSLDWLAREMGVPRPLTRQLITDLVRTGHLRVAQEICPTAGCAICPVRPTCQPTTATGLWELTDKGRRLLVESEPVDRQVNVLLTPALGLRTKG